MFSESYEGISAGFVAVEVQRIDRTPRAASAPTVKVTLKWDPVASGTTTVITSFDGSSLQEVILEAGVSFQTHQSKVVDWPLGKFMIVRARPTPVSGGSSGGATRPYGESRVGY